MNLPAVLALPAMPVAPARHALAVAVMALAGLLPVPQALAAPVLSRQQALHALDHQQATERAAAVARLADLGTMADSALVALRLRDEDEDVRELATAALWMIWSRSGDPATDRQFNRGLDQFGRGQLQQAHDSFSRVIQRRPRFAEAWNKRATVRFAQGRDTEALQDCEETLRRNPLHFGALAGMTQIHLRRGDAVQALVAYERALQINPNLEGGPLVLQRLEEAARRQGGERI